MHQLRGIGDRCAERLTYGLMSQTNAENRDFIEKIPDGIGADPGVLGAAGAGGEHQRVRLHGRKGLDRAGVIADDPQIGFDRTDQLIKVIGKAVVVINQYDHRRPSCASSSAWTTARALFRHSINSFSGTLSATMPAPDWTHTRPFFL